MFEKFDVVDHIADIDSFLRQLLDGLYYLHYHCNFVHGNLTSNCIVRSGKKYKITHWALNTLTENGVLLDAEALLPDDLRFLSPERCAHITRKPPRKSDVWALGLILAQVLCKSEISIPENPVVLARCSSSEEVLRVLNVSDVQEKYKAVLLAALEPRIGERANVRQLFALLDLQPNAVPVNQLDSFITFDKLTLNDEDYNCLNTRELYYLFCLSSPGHKDYASKSSAQNKEPPILTLPLSVTIKPNAQTLQSPSLTDCSCFSFVPSSFETLDSSVFRSRIAEVDKRTFLPLLVCPVDEAENGVSIDAQLPLVIRENDFTYQCERLALFKCLVQGSPYIRNKLIEAAKTDICPFYRSQVWGSLLDIKWSHLLSYDMTDKLTATTTDRQISVDIPRCHQYNDLLASPQGHIKLTRVLKAWLRHNESSGYVYWQGLDSLAAPFVILNFDNEKLAFACFNAFIHKYLRGFFNKDNSATIQEYLSLFSHLIAYHDPQLFNHLDQLGFTPELYAIPWFLTMFTHVLPLHKTIHLWDTLLMGDESFPLCVGVAILMQLRSQLLDYSFNDCILIFSDLPEINIETCVKEALKLYESTPRSAIRRDMVNSANFQSIFVLS